MKLSEFYRAVDDEFGSAYGGSLLADLALLELGGRSARVALSEGQEPREVWLALCRETGVPREKWYGAGRPEPRRDE